MNIIEIKLYKHSKQVATGVLLSMEEDYKAGNSWHINLNWNPDFKVSRMKRTKTMIRKVLPKNIL